MICEKCAGGIKTILCNSCGENIMDIGKYCYLCGAILREKREEAEGEDEALNLSERILCSDGTCIGVVEKGVCKLCGKPYIPES